MRTPAGVAIEAVDSLQAVTQGTASVTTVSPLVWVDWLVARGFLDLSAQELAGR